MVTHAHHVMCGEEGNHCSYGRRRLSRPTLPFLVLCLHCLHIYWRGIASFSYQGAVRYLSYCFIPLLYNCDQVSEIDSRDASQKCAYVANLGVVVAQAQLSGYLASQPVTIDHFP